MNEDERATHFQGFAKLEWKKIEAYIRTYGFIPEGETMRAEFLPPLYDLLAECAYDLMFHAVKHSLPYQQGDRVVKYIVSSHIPDLTQWPEGEQ